MQFSPNQNSASFFVEIDQSKCTVSKIAKTTLEKKNRVGGETLPAFKAHSKATVFKTLRYWHRDRQINQWSKIENPEIDSCVYG